MTINLRKITQGERGTLTFTWEFPENLTSPASISGATITATMTDEDGVTTAVSGTLTGTAATTCTWALSAGDSGTAGTFTVLFAAVVTGVTTYTLEATLEVIANPAVTGTQNDPLVSISAADAAWVTTSETAGNGATSDNLVSWTSGALADSGIAKTAVGNATELQGRTLISTAPGDGQAVVWDAGNSQWEPGDVSATDRVAKAGDTMTGSLVLEGTSTGGVLARPYLEFQAQGALVEGLWRQQQVTIGPEKYDNSLRWTYNSAWNAATTNDSRLIDGEHTILFGLESRWTSGGDPETMRGQVEWYLRVSPDTTGAIANHEAFAVLYDMDNERTAISFGSVLDTNNSITFYNGRMKIIGANTVDGTYGLRVDNLAIEANGGLKVSGSQLSVEGVYGGLGSSQYSQWIKSQIYPTTGGQVAFLRVGDGKFGYAAENIATAIGIWVHGNSITKNTSGTLTRTSAMTLTRPTVGAGNAALTFGNGNDVANPGFANYNIYQINTDPNYFAGMVRAASFGAGNLAANTATPSGATNFAMPIYNASGTLQGYIPVYAAQWS